MTPPTDARIEQKHADVIKAILGGYGIQVWEAESDNTKVLSPVAMKCAQALANAERDGRQEEFRAERYTDDESFLKCDDCGRHYVQAWAATDQLWKMVVKNVSSTLCQVCFMEQCRARGIEAHWSAATESEIEDECQTRATAYEQGRQEGLEQAAKVIEPHDAQLRKLMDAALMALSIEYGRAGSRDKCEDWYGPIAKAVMPFVDMPSDNRLASVIRALKEPPATKTDGG